MTYFLTIQHADGRTDDVRVIDRSISIPIRSTGNLILVDEHGQPASASLSGRGEDLVISLQNGILVTLEGFYAPDAPEMSLELATYAPDGKDSGEAEMALVADPDAAEMREEVEGGEGESDYQFNGTLGGGALGFGSGFTLMRFSNTEYIGFGDPIREVESTEGFYRGTPPVDREAPEVDAPAPIERTTAPAEGPVRFVPVGQPIEAPTPSVAPNPYRPWVAVDDMESIHAGDPITLSLIGNDTRGSRSSSLVRIEGNSVSPGDTVTLDNGAIVTVGSGGQVTYNPNGVFVALTDGESATDSFEYTISDGITESTATVTVDIAGKNDGPNAVDDHRTLNENGTVTFDPIANDSDPDTGDSVSFVSVATPTLGTIITNPGGTLTFDPGTDYDHLAVGESATQTVTYVIEDDQGVTDTATITLTINGQNDGPAAVNDHTSTPEETRVNLDLMANDSDVDKSDTLTISQINGQPATVDAAIDLGGGASATLKSDGTVDYQPGPGTNALDEGESLIDTFTYTIDDGNGGTATATANVTILGQDDPIHTVDDHAATEQTGGIAIDVLANDTDPDTSDTLSVLSVTDPSRGSTSINLNGTVQFEPGTDFTSLPVGETTIESFVYTVTTPDGDTDTATVYVTVTGENDGPTAVADHASTLEVTTVNVDLVTNDADPDTGDDLAVHEVAGISATPGLTIPLPSGASVVLLGNDTVNYTAAPSTNSLDAGETLIDTFDYIVKDESGATSTATATITINGVDDPIVAVNDTGTTPEGAPVVINVLTNDSDPDTSDTLTVTAVTTPPNGTIAFDPNGNLTFDPDGDFEHLGVGESATETVTYTVSTPDGDTASATLTITVTGSNDGPIATNELAITNEETLVNIDVLANEADPDTNDTVTLASIEGQQTTNPIVLTSGATVTVLANGTVNYQPAPGTNALDAGETAIDSFDYVVRDGSGATATATTTVTINGVDDPIVAVNDTGSANVGTPIMIDVLANDSDPDTSDTLSVTGVTQPTNGSVSTNPDGTVNFDPGSDFVSLPDGVTTTETFTYTVATPDGDTSTATVTVTITGGNDGPTAVADQAATTEQTTVNIDAIDNDSDPDADTLTVAAIQGQGTGAPVTLPSGAVVTLKADGTLDYAPAAGTNSLDAGETAIDSFTYTATDPSGATSTTTATVTINGVDDPIVAIDDAGTTHEGAPITVDVLANDSDPDTSDTLTVTGVTTPTNGTATVNPAGTITYNPDGDFEGLGVGESATETVTYTVTTPDGDTETATLTITVTGMNDGPSAADEATVTNEQVTVNVNVLANDTDPDTNDSLSVQSINGQLPSSPVTLASGATVTLLANGTVDYQPAAGTEALDTGETVIDTFAYVVVDDHGATSTATTTITINGVDDPISAVDDSGVTNESSTININVLANDSDPDASDTLAVTGVTQPRNGTTSINPDGSIEFDPNGEFEALGVGESATETVTYTVQTPDGDTATATLTVTINGENDGPGALDEAATTNEQTLVNLDILANDTDPDTNDTLSIQSIEGNLPGAPVTLASGATVTVKADGTVDYQPATSTNTLDAGETLIDTFDYVVTDSNGGSATATATVTINGIDDAIVAQDEADTTDEASAITTNVLANDSDPDTTDNPLEVQSIVQPANGTATLNLDGTITFDPDGDFEDLAVGETSIQTIDYVVENTDGATESATLTITVTGLNDGPTANDESASTNEQTLVNVDILDNDTDLDGDTLSVQSIEGSVASTVTLASGATVTVKADGTVDYQPAATTESLDAGESAVDSFDYTVVDQHGATATATTTITINGVDDPIVALDDAGSTSESSTISINVLANDSDPDTSDTLAITGVTQPGNGTTSVNPDGSILFDPNGEFEALGVGESATETVTYTVETPDGDTATATLTVTINGQNDGPTANGEATSTNEQTLVNLDILANDTDPDTNDVLSIQSIEGSLPGSPITLSSGAVVTVKANGTVDYQPAASTNVLDAGETLIDSFDYIVTDSEGGSATATATVTINGVDDPIVVNNDANVTSESSAVTTNVLANDSDPDTSDVLSVTGVSTPGTGTATVNGDNTITFDPNGGFESLAVGETAIETLTYSVINTDGATESATLTITVTGENDGPAAFDESTTTQEQTLVNIDVAANDTDIDGDTLSVQSIEGSTAATITLTSGATVTVLANGTVDYQPASTTHALDTGETAIDSFDYVVEDGNGGSATATATITITGVDDPINAVDDVGSTNESTAINIEVLANDNDPDATDTLRVTGVTQPGSGLTTVNIDGTVNFDPNGAFEGLGVGETAIETFDYTVMTPDGDTETATVTVTVTGESDGPTANDEATSTNEQILVNLDVLANDTDPDTNDTLSIQSIEGRVPTAPIMLASGATVTVKADGTVDYQPAATTESLDSGESLIDTFDYVVLDTAGATSTATATVTVLGVDDPIVALDDTNTTTEDASVVTDVLANDSDPDSSDTLTVIAVTTPTNGTALINGDGDIVFDPAGAFEGLAVGESATETLDYTVRTPDGDTETATLTITVTGVNDGPTAIDESASTNEEVSVNVDILTNDTDPDLTDTLSIQSIDGELPTNLITLASGATITVRADQTIDYQPAISTNTLDAGETLIDTFDYIIEDESGASATATTTITINGVDDPTNARDDFGTTDESTAINVSVLANDSDPDTSDTLAVTGVTQPGNGTTSVNLDGSINFNPNGEFEGLGQGESATETVTYTVETPDGDTATATLTVTINGQNDGPVALGEATSTLEEAKVNLDILANDTDADTNDVLSIQSIENQTTGAPITLSSGAIVTVLADGTVDYQSAPSTGALDQGETLIDTFDYVINDGNGATASATATVTINGVDDPIVALDDQAGTNPTDTVTIDVLANDSDPDTSDALAISSITQPTNGSASIVGSEVVFDPDGDFDSLPVGATAVETFTYVVGTPDGDTETATVFVTITGGNDGPTAVADSEVTNEQVLVNVDLLANDSDPDTGDTLSIQWIDGKAAGSPVTLASGATVTLKSDGTVDYTPAADTESLDEGETRIDTFDYVVADQSGVTSTATATITINGVDDPLVANDESNVATESTGVTTNVLANDTDPDATDRPLAVQAIAQPANGLATLNANGTISFDPGGEFETLAVGETQIETIDYVVVNQDGATENATLTITVTGLNDGPTALNEAASVNEQSLVNVDILDNDSDLDGDTLTLQSVEGQGTGAPITLGSGATVTVLANGTVDYQAAASTDSLDAGESAIDSFDYIIQDGQGGSATATTTITILGVDDPITALDDMGTTDQASAINIDVLANDSDPDTSDTLAVTGVTAPGNGSVSILSNGTLQFDPNGNFDSLGVGESATETMTYTVETPDGDTATATLTVTITGQNDGPVALDDAATTTEETLVNLDVLDNDSDVDTNDVLSIQSIAGQPTGAPVLLASGATVTVLGNGTVDYQPAGTTNALDDGETFIDTFNYVVSDGEGGTATATARVTVNGVDDPLVALDDNAGTNPTSAIQIDVLANDSDPDSSDTLGLVSVTQPTNGSVAISGGQITFDPDGDFDALPDGATAVETFTYVVGTPDGDTETATVNVTVTGGNDAPTAVADFATTDEQVAVNLDLVANDTDPDTGDTLSIATIQGSTNSTVTLVSGATVTVKPDGTVDYQPAASTEALDAGESLIDTFTYTVTDLAGVTSTATATVTVNGVDDALVANDEVNTTTEEASVTTNVLANDSDPDVSDRPLAVQSIGQPVNGTATLNGDGTITFDPNDEFEALGVGQTQVETIDYIVVNQDGATESATLTITVSGLNDSPAALDESTSTFEETLVNIDILDNDTDIDGDTVTLQSIEGSTSGTVTLSSGAVVTIKGDGTVDYQPAASTGALDAGETVIDSFDYVVEDPSGATSTATTTITINGVDDPMALQNDQSTTDETTAINVDVLANDSDPDTSDALSVTGLTAPGNGSVSVNPDGTIRFDPNGDFESLAEGQSATETMTYTVETPDGDTATATLTVTINGVNDDPDAVDDSWVINELQTVNVDLLANDTDVDNGDTLTLSQLDGQSASSGPIVLASGATITLQPDGTVDYQAAPTTAALNTGESATDTFTYVVTDSEGATDTATATITINGVTTLPPEAVDDTATTAENTVVNLDILANDSEPDVGDSFSLQTVEGTTPTVGSPITLSSGATVTLKADGTIDYQPAAGTNALDAGESATDSFIYTIVDTQGNTDTATANITINGVDDALAAQNDADSTTEHAATTFNVLTNDSDPDTTDNPLTLSSVTDPGRGSISFNANGEVTFDPGNDFEFLDDGETAIESVTYTVENQDGDTTTATHTITINGEDDALVANDEVAVITEDSLTTVSVLTNDFDPDNTDNALSIQSIVQPASGTATLNGNGTITYNPNGSLNSLAAGETSIQTVDYVVENNDGATETATLTITVTGLNDGPTANGEATSTLEQTTVNLDILANDTDPDATDTLTIQSLENGGNLPSGATVMILPNGTVDYSPAASTGTLDAGETLIDTFDYVVQDGNGGSATATATVTINGVDDPISANPDQGTTDEATDIDVAVLTNDSDPDASDTLVVIGVTQPGNGTTTVNGDGSINFDPDGDFESLGAGESATETVNYTVQTPDGDTATSTLTVTINGLNDGPTANDEATSTLEQTTVNIDILANETDPDTNDTLSIQSIEDGGTLASGATVTVLANGTVNYTPAASTGALDAGETLIDTFDYVVVDGSGATATATATITINGVDEPLVAQNDADSTDEDNTTTFNVLANDSDPDATDNPLTLTNVTDPTNGSVGFTANGNVTFNPGGDFNYLDAGETAIETVTYTVQNQDGVTETATHTITITGVDDALVANDESNVTTESAAITTAVLANDSDPDTTDNALAVQSITQPASGTATLNANGTVTYDPNGTLESLAANETSIQTIDYIVENQDGATESATLTITVTGQNDGPTANDESTSTLEQTTVTIDIVGNDTDPDMSDTLSIQSIENGGALPSGATVTIRPDGQVDYQPAATTNTLDAGETLIDTFDYVVTDSNGGSATATATITINGVDDPITANPDTGVTNESTDIDVNVLTNDSDPDASDTLTVIGVTQPGNGTTSVNGDGTINFDPNGQFEYLDAGESATETVTYTVQTPDGDTATSTLTVTINGQDDPLIALNDADSTTENASTTFNVLTNDSDADASDEPLTLTAITQPANGSISFDPGGSVTFNPGSAFNYLDAGETAIETVTYTVQNQDGATETATHTITIFGQDDALVAQNDAVSTFENQNVTTNVLANDSDPDTTDNPLTLTAVTQPTNGSVTFNSNGNIQFQPGTDFDYLAQGETAIETVTYTVTNQDGVTETATHVITINGVNDAPDLAPDSVTISPVLTPQVTGGGWADNTAEAGSTTVTFSGSALAPNGGNETFNNINAFSDSGVQNSAALQVWFDENGTGGSGTITFSFSQAVKDPILHIDRLGGTTPDGSNSAQLTLTTPGASLTRLSGVGHFNVSGNQIFRTVGDASSGSQSSTSATSGTAAGSVQINGTVTSVTFSVVMIGSLGVGDEMEFKFGIQEASYEPETINVLTNDSDPEGDSLTLIGVTQPTNGSVSFSANGNITFDPGNDFDGLNDGQNLTETLTYTVRDANGATSTETVSFTVEGTSHAAEVAPVVIDLDGDGAEFRGVEDGILMDVDGDGEAEQTAWAGNDDAVLIYDENENDDVDGSEEFAFAQYVDGAETDLEGLSHFDTDGSGMLAEGDEEFSKFKLWQDKDGDGIVGEGELTSLTDAGIESLELLSDGIGYQAADGDVFVHGTTQVNYADGTTGSAADAAFDYREVDQSDIVQPEGDDAPLEVQADATISGTEVNLDEVPPTSTEGPAEGGTTSAAEADFTPPPVAVPATSDEDAAAAAASHGA